MANKQMVLDFFDALNEEQAKRHIYKFTDCGAWIEFKKTGITIGSIVEGSDACTESHELLYKDNFTKDDIQDVINCVEAEADELWHEANDE